MYCVHRDGSSFKWHQPCKNQTALQAQHLGGHSERAVKSYSHSFRATCDKGAVKSAVSKRSQWSGGYCMAGSSCRCSGGCQLASPAARATAAAATEGLVSAPVTFRQRCCTGHRSSPRARSPFALSRGGWMPNSNAVSAANDVGLNG